MSLLELTSLIPDTLCQLRQDIDDCLLCAGGNSEEIKYRHIWGEGCYTRPDIMLVLMNPTARNRTAHPDYQGTRLPFAGIKAFWKVLVEADLLPQSLLEDFADRDWNEERTRRVIATLNQEKLYVTNLVKCVSARAADPGTAEINYGLSVLQREIELVQPRYIVAFGLLVFRAITGQTLKLGDYLARLESGETGLESRYYSVALNEINYPVFPCYFPTGRGNSRAATACLRLLNKNLRSIK